MFGYSFPQLYFIINMLYTIFMFFFLHSFIVERIFKIHHDMTEQEIRVSMNMFYIIGAFTGSIRLLKDILNLIFDHKSCIWLHWLYRDKE